MEPVLAAYETCTGCGACAEICPKACITMKPDQKGFAHPAVDPKQCIGCLRCQNACPIETPLQLPEQKSITYAGKSLNNENRNISSSGGVFSELVSLVLKKGGIVCGASFDEAFTVKHSFAETMDQAAAFRGAKYSQSELIGVFRTVREQLDNGRMVLFSGLPCQVGGLLGFLGKHYPNLVCVDFVCHSVPSPELWKRYLKYRSDMDGHGKAPLSVNMRSKETGWSRYRYSVQIRFPNGLYSAISKDDPYMKLFISGCISRESCASCRFKGLDRLSDITLGDCWGVWAFDPQFDDDKGVSLIIVHSKLGHELLKEAGDSLSFHVIDAEEAIKRNPAIMQAVIPYQKRNAVQDRLLRNNDFDAAAKLLAQKSILDSVKTAVKRFLK